jgi:hypothetical protein
VSQRCSHFDTDGRRLVVASGRHSFSIHTLHPNRADIIDSGTPVDFFAGGDGSSRGSSGGGGGGGGVGGGGVRAGGRFMGAPSVVVDAIRFLTPGVFEADHVEVAVMYTRKATGSRFVVIFDVSGGDAAALGGGSAESGDGSAAAAAAAVAAAATAHAGGGGGAAAAARGAVKLRCVLVHDPYNITDAATAPNGALLRQQLHPLPWVPGGFAVTTHNGLLLFGPSARRAPVRITLPAPSAASAVSALKPTSVVAAGGVDAARCELVLVLDDARAVRVSVTPGLRTTAAEAGVLARPSIVTVLASGSVSVPLLFFLAHRGSQ